MKKILVVGFGGMGCRHVQSLLSSSHPYEIHVVEPLEENILQNCQRIDARPEAIFWYKTVEEADLAIDLAIVATSAEPRFSLVKKLIKKGVKLFLLEKIVFQSKQQFDQIIALMRQNGVKAYCNFVNRYFNAYNYIREYLGQYNFQVRMTVYGGEFGLGCNAIHYIDTFQYITQSNGTISITNSILFKLDNENRRGNQYKEFGGALSVGNEKGDALSVISEKNFSGGVVINVYTPKKNFLLSEQSQRYYILDHILIETNDFLIIPTSKLTAQIVEEIFTGNCRLTTVELTMPAHVGLFRHFNTMLAGYTSDEMICSIT